jgi:hypothetical protein
LNLAEGPVRVQLSGISFGGSGPDLTGYPHLTHAPSPWGEGVRCASNGTAVIQVAAERGDHLGFQSPDGRRRSRNQPRRCSQVYKCLKMLKSTHFDPF